MNSASPSTGEITRHVFKKGERVNAMMTAGADMEVWSAYGISADVFAEGRLLRIPLIESRTPGSGKLDAFLAALKGEAGDRKVIFTSVMNAGLARHLKVAGIPFLTHAMAERKPSAKNGAEGNSASGGDEEERLLANIIGQRGKIVGDHLWAGHHGTIVRVERTAVGWGVVVHLECGRETFVFDGPKHWRRETPGPPARLVVGGHRWQRSTTSRSPRTGSSSST